MRKIRSYKTDVDDKRADAEFEDIHDYMTAEEVKEFIDSLFESESIAAAALNLLLPQKKNAYEVGYEVFTKAIKVLQQELLEIRKERIAFENLYKRKMKP